MLNSHIHFLSTLRELTRNRRAMFGLIVVAVVIFMALFAPLIVRSNPYAMVLEKRLTPPSRDELLGRDELGRSVLSRLIFGAQTSLLVALSVISISLSIGIMAGVIAGYLGGKVDALIMRLGDVFFAFPGLILAIGLMAALGQSLTNVVIALATVSWPGYARVVRSETLRLREMEFVLAARAMGCTKTRMIFQHMLPNAVAPAIVLGTLGFGWAILAEAGLSFLGLGVSPPTPSWGAMIASGRQYLQTAPHVGLIPGIAISMSVLAFNLLGDSLRDALDPRLKL